jgi:hypothetical protein
MTNGESGYRPLPARASPSVPSLPSRALGNSPKTEVQANSPTCFSNTVHASGPYFSFHSV